MYLDRFGIAHECDYVPDNKILDDGFIVQITKRDKDGNYITVGEEEFPRYPNNDQITWCLCHYKGTSATIRQVFYLADLPFSGDKPEIPGLIDIADIDMGDTVFITLSNPHYDGEEINRIEVGYEYPKEKIRIIEAVKLAVRCGLTFSFHSQNAEAEDFTARYYEEYKS